MNFLAHAFLAGNEPPLIVGGVAGDWIKGWLPGSLPSDLARGVALHRAIDSHAETHPAFKASRQRVGPGRRRYAGVLVDIFYDHLLARDWALLHPMPLREFTPGVYAMVATRCGELPAGASFPLQLMAREDWLESYARIDGIADVLRRMARRAGRHDPLAGGEEELMRDLGGFVADFRHWLADASAFSHRWRGDHPGHSTTPPPG